MKHTDLIRGKALKKGVWIDRSLALLTATLSIAALVPVVSFANPASTLSLTILYTNDSHGRMGPFPRIATLVEGIRSEVSNVLLLDAGDTFLGDPTVNFFDGKPMVEIMNAMDYDVMAIGNHEFDRGQGVLLERSQEVEFPLLAANLRWKANPDVIPPYADDYTIVEVGTVRVAIFGLITQELPVVAHPLLVENLIVLNPIEVASEYVPRLRGEADLVVALTHLGYSVDVQLAQQVSGIDIIVGGHSHTKLEEPVVVNNTIIVQAWEYGKVLGRLDLTLEEGRIVAHHGKLIPITAEIPEDPDVKSIVDHYTGLLREMFREVVGETLVPLDGSRPWGVRTQETNLGNLVADAIRWYMADLGVEIAVQNGGGLRWHRVFPAGPITLGDVYELLPFPNMMVAKNLPGENIWRALERSVSKYPLELGGFLHVSGLSFVFDPTKPPFKRVVSVYVNGEPLDNARSYRVGMNDFLAAGGDAYVEFLGGENVVYTGIFYVEPLLAYLKEFSPVAPAKEGRILAVPPLATVDFDPDVINLAGKGRWITAYIERPGPYRVEDVVIENVKLWIWWVGRSFAAKWGEVQDGVLMVKFERAEIASALEGVVGEVELTVVGPTVDGKWIKGEAATRTILPKGRMSR